VPVGTTGESPTVSHEEHRRVIEICVDVADRRVPVVAGAGSNSTDEAVSLTKFAEDIGADAILSVVPYYNKPTQEGLFQHFSAVAKATSLPVMLYSVPGRTVVDIAVDTMARLRDAYPNIIGVKDATASMEKASMTRAKLGPEFILLSGEDMTALGFMAHGGHGCISVTSNVAPKLCAQFQNACMQGNYTAALMLQDKLVPAAQGAVPREQPRRHQIRRQQARTVQERVPPAGGADHGGNEQAIDSALSFAGLLPN